jgi:hypothetical protein
MGQVRPSPSFNPYTYPLSVLCPPPFPFETEFGRDVVIIKILCCTFTPRPVKDNTPDREYDI